MRLCPTRSDEGVRELTSLPIPTALLSNRSKWQMDKLLSPSGSGRQY